MNILLFLFKLRLKETDKDTFIKFPGLRMISTFHSKSFCKLTLAAEMF